MPKFIRIVLFILTLALIAGSGYALLQFVAIQNQVQVLNSGY